MSQVRIYSPARTAVRTFTFGASSAPNSMQTVWKQYENSMVILLAYCSHTVCTLFGREVPAAKDHTCPALGKARSKPRTSERVAQTQDEPIVLGSPGDFRELRRALRRTLPRKWPIPRKRPANCAIKWPQRRMEMRGRRPQVLSGFAEQIPENDLFSTSDLVAQQPLGELDRSINAPLSPCIPAGEDLLPDPPPSEPPLQRASG